MRQSQQLRLARAIATAHAVQASLIRQQARRRSRDLQEASISQSGAGGCLLIPMQLRIGIKKEIQMPSTAKLFTTGRSQAVRLPKEFRFQGTEVFIRRNPATGEVVLSPNPSLSLF
jgi:hypothetical protein